MLAQGVGDFVPNNGSQLIVREFEACDQTREDNDLAARHAVGVDFVAADGVDFPLPIFSIRPEGWHLRDQALRDAAHPCRDCRICVQGPGALGFLHGIGISQG